VRDGGSMDPGLLSPTMDVLFNSVGSIYMIKLPLKQARLTGIEIVPFVPQPSRRPKWESCSDPSSPFPSPILLKDHTGLPIDTVAEYGRLRLSWVYLGWSGHKFRLPPEACLLRNSGLNLSYISAPSNDASSFLFKARWGLGERMYEI
jgi:hypothetical protein